MKFLLITIICLQMGFSVYGQERPVKGKKTKPLPKQAKESTELNKKEVDNGRESKQVNPEKEKKEENPEKEVKAANTVIFRGSDLGKFWEKIEKKNQLIYSPDSMRMTSKYKKFVFDLSEFKKMGGSIGADTVFTIHYNVLQTDIESKTPDDPNMPSPAGGFTYIINTCQIEKVEAN